MYNKKTILEGKETLLSEEERNGVEQFHKSRLAFAIRCIEDSQQILVNLKDSREHRVYLKEDYGIEDEEFETLIRGFVKPNRIVFYKTSYFIPIPKCELSDDLLLKILEMARSEFGCGNYSVQNGLSIGKLGEEWESIEILGEYHVEESIIMKM